MTLDLQLNERITFNSFIVGDNAEAVHALQTIFSSSEFCLSLWGDTGVGRSHLLQSCAHAAGLQEKKVMYIALGDYQSLSPDIVRGIDQYDLLLWDDVDAIAGLHEWEVALFHGYNQLQSAGAKLVYTAATSPLTSPIQLPDFRTRLAAGVTYQIKSLHDEQKLSALQQRAKSRGMQLTDSVGRYLLNHCPRDLSALFACLDQLDSASLEEKRMLTIPFVKSVLMGS